MIAAERRKRIYELALQRGSVSVSELAQELDAAENTIRSDLDSMDREGKLVRSRGGAVVRETGQPVLPYSQIRDSNMQLKAHIAAAAVQFLPEAGSVFINAGSTTHQLCLRLSELHKFDLTTNSPEIALYAVGRGMEVSLVGGKIIAESQETDGSLNGEMLEGVYWDAVFIGLTALDIEHGITSINIPCSHMEASVMRNSRLVVGLCDSSKIGRFARARAGDISMLNILITDSGADPEFLRLVREMGVEVIVAETE